MSEETATSSPDDDVQTDARLIERAAAPHLAALSEKARDYARNARSENTRRAYEADWRQFAAWLRRQGLDPLPPDPQTVGLYLAACMEGLPGREPLSVASLERRLAGICWRYRQRGAPLDTSDRHISTVLAG
ncbi:MAG: integrase, partial [Methylocystis silviterrae]